MLAAKNNHFSDPTPFRCLNLLLPPYLHKRNCSTFMNTAPPTTAPQPGAGCVDPQYANDKWCDDQNNNAKCNWDGGACCNNDFDGWDTYCSSKYLEKTKYFVQKIEDLKK